MAEKTSNAVWSKFKDSDFTDEQYRKAAALDRGDSIKSVKERFGLPIREPDGTLNVNAVSAAASRIGEVKGASDVQKKAAAKKISAAYAAMGETPPDAIKKLVDEDSMNGGKQEMADDLGARFFEGDFVEVRYGIGRDRMRGKVSRIVTDGSDVSGINDDFKITGTEESPAAEVEIHYQGEPSGKVIGFKTSMLRKSFTDDYSEEEGEDDQDLGEDEAVEVQTPFDFGEATKIGRKLWRKQILPFRKIKARGKTFSFDSKKADKVIASHDAGAFDQVPFVLGHTNNPEMGRGELKGFVKTKDGLDALIETDARGSEMVENNQNLGVSVRYLDNYTREADGKKFGPAIQHVAATYMPRMTGMAGWKPVNLGEDLRGRLALDFSDEETEVLDLTGSGWESADAPDTPNEKPSGSYGDDVHLDDDDRWMIAQVLGEAGLLESEEEDFNEGANADANTDDEEEGDELSTKEKTAYEERISNLEYRLKAQNVEAYLDECMQAGVPKADIDAARPVLLSAVADDEFEYTELSEDGAQTKKATTTSQIKAMLESRKGTVELGERGADDAQNPNSDETRVVKIRDFQDKNEGMTFGEASRVMAERGEI